jgi:hypothetical protein
MKIFTETGIMYDQLKEQGAVAQQTKGSKCSSPFDYLTRGTEKKKIDSF